MIRAILGITIAFERNPDMRIFDEQNFSVAALREELDTPSLFGEAKSALLLYVLTSYREELLSFLEEYKGKGDIIIRERELSAKDEKTLVGLGVKIERKTETVKAVEFNVWPLTDAILSRDKKTAWLLYRGAIERGTAPEELSGIIWWQVKSMLLVVREGNPKGMKPFTLNKTKQSLQKYKPEEIESLGKKLMQAIHEPRAGNGTAENWLESFLLSM